MRVSDCCSADVHYPPSMWGMSRNYYLCAHCGMACTGLDYPEPARPTREDDTAPPRSACCDAPLESGVRAHWCSADGCGRQARPDGDGYNVRGASSDDRGPCERVGRYLDGAIETASEIMRLLARRGL